MHRRSFLHHGLLASLSGSILGSHAWSQVKGQKAQETQPESYLTPWWGTLHAHRPLKGFYAELPGAKQTWISALRSDQSRDGAWQSWDQKEFEKLGVGWPGFVNRCGHEAARLLVHWTSKADRTQDGTPFIVWNRHELANGNPPKFKLPPATGLLLINTFPKSYTQSLTQIFGDHKWYASAPSQDFCFLIPAKKEAVINFSNTLLQIYDTAIEPGTLEIFEFQQIEEKIQRTSLGLLAEG